MAVRRVGDREAEEEEAHCGEEDREDREKGGEFRGGARFRLHELGWAVFSAEVGAVILALGPYYTKLALRPCEVA